jgi:hypothetical protein
MRVEATLYRRKSNSGNYKAMEDRAAKWCTKYQSLTESASFTEGGSSTSATESASLLTRSDSQGLAGMLGDADEDEEELSDDLFNPRAATPGLSLY